MNFNEKPVVHRTPDSNVADRQKLRRNAAFPTCMFVDRPAMLQQTGSAELVWHTALYPRKQGRMLQVVQLH